MEAEVFEPDTTLRILPHIEIGSNGTKRKDQYDQITPVNCGRNSYRLDSYSTSVERMVWSGHACRISLRLLINFKKEVPPK